MPIGHAHATNWRLSFLSFSRRGLCVLNSVCVSSYHCIAKWSSQALIQTLINTYTTINSCAVQIRLYLHQEIHNCHRCTSVQPSTHPTQLHWLKDSFFGHRNSQSTKNTLVAPRDAFCLEISFAFIRFSIDFFHRKMQEISFIYFFLFSVFTSINHTLIFCTINNCCTRALAFTEFRWSFFFLFSFHSVWFRLKQIERRKNRFARSNLTLRRHIWFKLNTI